MPQLNTDIAELCDRTIDALPSGSTSRDALERIAERAAEPLTVAVAGRLKSGKSTLVNALLGQRVAPVAVGECTRVVTWFRYGARERVTVTPRSGAEWTVRLAEDGRLPSDLGAAAADISHVTAWLSNARLSDMTLIDTPGLDSSDGPTSAATEDLLGLGEAHGQVQNADALIFLLPHLLEQDTRRLRSFAAQLGNTASSPITTIAVLSRIDQLTTDADPWPHARRTARSLADELRRFTFGVLPVNGLVAETSAAEAFTEEDATALRRIADGGPALIELALLSPDDFLEAALDVTRPARVRLLGLLGLTGIRRAVAFMQAGTTATAGLLKRLAEESGFAELDATIREVMSDRANALKAQLTIDALERLSFQGTDPADRAVLEALREQIGVLSLHPELHTVRELEILSALRRDSLDLTATDLATAERLLTGRSPHERLGLPTTKTTEEVAAAALALTARWQEIENDPRSDRTARDAASVIRHSLMIIWEQGGGSTT